jgi:hypothetical protein
MRVTNTPRGRLGPRSASARCKWDITKRRVLPQQAWCQVAAAYPMAPSCNARPTCVAICRLIPAPLALRAATTYARSPSGVRGSPGPREQTPAAASAAVPAGHTMQRLYLRPPSSMATTTLAAPGAAQAQRPPDRPAGCHAAVRAKPFAKEAWLPAWGSQRTQLRPLGDG